MTKPRLALKRGLPRTWANHPNAKGLIAETDIAVTGGARLRAKALLFKTPRDLRRFWPKALGLTELGKAVGAVHSLMSQVESFGPKGYCVSIEADPRYFCVIGLVTGYCNVEVLAHEAVHAGYAYEKRVKRSPFAGIHDLDEERVAYPVGRIASSLATWLKGIGEYAKR